MKEQRRKARICYKGSVINRIPEPGQGVTVYSICAGCKRAVKLQVLPQFADAFQGALAARCSICRKGSRWERVENS